MNGTRGSRREFLKTGVLAAGGAGLGFALFRGLRETGSPPAFHPALGPLKVVRDETTGLPLLMLPDGFRYHTFGWAGVTMSDGYQGPLRCDGMGVVGAKDHKVTMIRNHELRGSSGAMGNPETAWDVTGGGTTTMVFNIGAERLEDVFISLNGTLNNCAGGVTPWGTWLSCEEAVFTPERAHLGIESRQSLWSIGDAQRAHGFVFEVIPGGVDDPRPILEMGQFWHEAAAVDPDSGIVYMTEDRSPYAGFYRFIPQIPGQLDAGGTLQMMRVKDQPKLIRGITVSSPMAIDWVDIERPEQGHTSGTHDGRGVVTQGMEAGGSAFRALEGCAWSDGQVYFTSKNGGAARAGYIFRLDIASASLKLLYESQGRGGFSGPDNIIFSPRGGLVVCEDRETGNPLGQFLAGLDTNGELYAFSRINPAISGMHLGHDLASTAGVSEWAGACFSPDGQWMFVNLYHPGLTCAITGPWVDGLI
jgi:uncharacterized repeat protein (TIGR03803 family)